MLTIAIVGAGLMGRGIAATVLAAGHGVVLHDANPAALDALDLRPPARRAADLADAVAGADMVIEAIAEDLAAKRSLFAELAGHTDTLLASNTSVLPISEIARDAARPERIVGTHWWNPAQLIPIVEVVRGERTGDAAMDRAVAILAALGKTPVRVERDVPGFVGNRLQHALWREAIALVEDGVCDAETVDLVVRGTLGLRLGAMGPLENADYVGLDLTLAIHEAVLSSLSRASGPAALLQAHVAAGELGAKTGSGFLHWGEGAREAAARRLAAHVARQLSVGDRAEHSQEKV